MSPCPIKWVGRSGLGVKALTYCGREANAAAGVVQIPVDAKICETCKTEIAKVPR